MARATNKALYTVYEGVFDDGTRLRMSIVQDGKRYGQGQVDFEEGRRLVDRIRNPTEIWAPSIFKSVYPRPWSPDLARYVADWHVSRRDENRATIRRLVRKLRQVKADNGPVTTIMELRGDLRAALYRRRALRRTAAKWLRRQSRARLIRGCVYVLRGGRIIGVHDDPMDAPKVARITPKKALQQLVRALDGHGDVNAALDMARAIAA